MPPTPIAQFPQPLQRFVERAPVAVMVRLILENQLRDTLLDDIFHRTAERQYTRSLTFSSVAQLLSQVVLGQHRSVHAAYTHASGVPATIAAVYDKLGRTEPVVVEALVRDTSARMHATIHALGPTRPEPVSGYRLRILDGNHLAATERRLQPLRGSNRAPLPGQALFLYDVATDLITAMVGCEDAHANERAYLPRILDDVRPGDLIVGDRSFCTRAFLHALHGRGAGYLIRWHPTMPYELTGRLRRRGRGATGVVSERTARLYDGEHQHTMRAIVIRRRRPLRKGGKTVVLLTNLPATTASAVRLAELYLQRWRVEEGFRRLTCELRCEINTLGYPKAALLALSLAVLAYNTLAAVRAALAAAHDWTTVDKQISFFHIATEVRIAYEGLDIAVPEQLWKPYADLDVGELAQLLRSIAAQVRLSKYLKKTRGPKHEKPRRRNLPRHHQATARVLADAGHKRP